MIKVIMNQILKYTFIMYIQKYFKGKFHLQVNGITNYWNKHKRKKNIKEEKIILVECMEDLSLKLNTTYSFLPVLSKLYNTKVIALTSYKSYHETTRFLSFYHTIDKIESVYKPFDFLTKIKSIFILFSNLPFVYSLEYGFKVIVKEVDIGDLIYDEYLRIAKVETCRKATILFYLMCYNAIYQHLRYKNILDKNNITDILAIRDTYSHSSFYRAATNLDNITIWKNIMTPSSAIISKVKAFKNFNYKPQYFQIKHLKYIKDSYSKESIESMYNNIIVMRSSKEVRDSIDVKEMLLAHANHDIITEEDFLKSFTIESDKRVIVIYAHVFVDAVRYAHHPIFSDYYTWLIETLKFLVKKKDVNILIKPHPSEVLYSLGRTVKEVIEEFIIEYNANIIFLDKKIDVNVIYKIADIIVTASGTIGVEAPCLGVKVITAGSTMYENTNAMFRSNTQEKYFELLQNFESLPSITSEQQLNSKIGFIWINKLIYVQSNLYRSLDEESGIINQAKVLDRIYRNATIEDSKNIFERICNDKFN